MQMKTWTGTIIGPAGTVHDGRIYTLRIICGMNYPKQAPQIWFRSKVGSEKSRVFTWAHLQPPCPQLLVHDIPA